MRLLPIFNAIKKIVQNPKWHIKHWFFALKNCVKKDILE